MNAGMAPDDSQGPEHSQRVIGALTRGEIDEQPEAWAQVLHADIALTELNVLTNSVFLGSGIALYVARCAAAVAKAAGGPTSYAVPAQDAYAFLGAVATEQPSLYVMVARTGDVSDSIRSFDALRCAPGIRVAIIGEEGGPLADLADRVVNVGIREQSVVTTKTLTSTLLALQIGIWRALDYPGLGGLSRLPDAMARVLPEYDAIAQEEASRDYDEIVVIGSGPYYGLAEAGALTIREMSLSYAVAHHALVYPHGQKVTIDERTCVILFASDSAHEDEQRVLKEVRALGGRSIAVGEGVSGLGADAAVELSCGLSEWQRLVLVHPFTQLFGYHRALGRMVDPDRPRHLPKVF